jgi:peptidoglycan/LPS O-acetylase OafA/YrhL
MAPTPTMPQPAENEPSRGAVATAGSGDPAAGGHVHALDGMRAVAVILVLLFHLQVPGFTAGFLGVDIFFVLSGFLITTLILTEIDRTGRISLPDFWARRARRLLPALAILLVTVAAVTWATATFTERTSVRGDLLATAGYVANWHLITTSSYFADIGVDSPLEHTWSLAIEEQFYVLWPLVVFAVAAAAQRRRRPAVGMVAGIVAIGSATLLWILWSPESVERAYMGTDARIFEPLVGAVGAVLVATPWVRRRLDRWGALSLVLGVAALGLGLAMIAVRASSYYFGGALFVSVATLLILGPLWIGRGGVLGKALAWTPVAWIGVVSYGAYLWHWPLIVWLGAREASGNDLFVRRVAAGVLTFVIAGVSFYLVERPIRRRATHPARTVRIRRRRWTLAAVPISLVAIAGISVAATRVPDLPPRVPVMMLVGDSVPLHLSVAMERELSDRDWRLVSSTFGSCPVTGEAPAFQDGRPIRDAHRCSEEIVIAQDRLVDLADPDVIVWWDRWSLSGFLSGGGFVPSGTPRFWNLRRERLQRAVNRLTSRGARIVLVADEPPGRGIATRCTERRCHAWISFQIDHYDDITRRWNSIMRRFAQRHPDRATFISVTDAICAEDVAPCDDAIEGVPARPDGTHYEGEGERLVIRTLFRLLSPLMEPLTPPEHG